MLFLNLAGVIAFVDGIAGKHPERQVWREIIGGGSAESVQIGVVVLGIIPVIPSVLKLVKRWTTTRGVICQANDTPAIPSKRSWELFGGLNEQVLW